MQAGDVIMIEPHGFGVNPETAASNTFQARIVAAKIDDKALVEHRRLVESLRDAGIRVTVLQPHRDDIPDAVFPNNWLTTDAQGRVVLYPMEADSRQKEVRPGIGEELGSAGYDVAEILDLTDCRSGGMALEGTGSLVIDHVNRIVYTSRSSRTSEVLVQEWCKRFEYTACVFDALDAAGKPVYHTNVIMGIGSTLAVVCLEAITEPDAVCMQLEESGKQILDISWEQVTKFAGNVLFLRGKRREVMAISQQGWTSLSAKQRDLVSKHAEPVPVAVDTIESTGGGSVRCMIAEIFLPRS